MAAVLNVDNIPDISKKLKNEKVVLAGGCFDVLHPGHVIFLQKAKKVGDILVVLLESDEKIKKLKGVNRPVHNQKERAKILSALKVVDYVVLLPSLETDKEYDELIAQLKPDIIAVTKGLDNYHHKRASKLVGARFKYVTAIIGDYSTTKILTQN